MLIISLVITLRRGWLISSIFPTVQMAPDSMTKALGKLNLVVNRELYDLVELHESGSI